MTQNAYDALHQLRKHAERLRECEVRTDHAKPQADAYGFVPAVFIIMPACDSCGAPEGHPCNPRPLSWSMEKVADVLQALVDRRP